MLVKEIVVRRKTEREDEDSERIFIINKVRSLDRKDI